jgi:hypothetical protein
MPGRHPAYNRIVRILAVFLAAAVLLAQPAQTPAPVFTRDGIVPLQSNAAKFLAPGMTVELYGQHLAPEPWCGQNATPPAPYPLEVCGVQVLVGTSPAGLMYVGPVQINFKIPADAPAQGSAPVQVCVRGVCGAPVAMQFSAYTASLRLRGTAAVHMPVWVEVDAPAPYEFKYPCFNDPWWGPNEWKVEVRYGGQPLSQWPPQMPRFAVGNGFGCTAGVQRSPMPLHLLYHFDQPGVYSVRVSGMLPTPADPSSQVFQSDWTDITVAPETDAARDQWLQSMAQQVKSAPQEALLTDVIPSLLAWPDEKALAILLPFLDLPPGDRTGQFARSALAGFSDDVLRRLIPPDRLLSLCPPDGRCRGQN